MRISDWSSDVCSSDLKTARIHACRPQVRAWKARNQCSFPRQNGRRTDLDEPGPLQQGFYFFQHSCWRKSSRINDLRPICRLQRCTGAIAVALVSGAYLLAKGRDSSLNPLCAQLLVPTLRAPVGAGFHEDFQLRVGEIGRAHVTGTAESRVGKDGVNTVRTGL